MSSFSLSHLPISQVKDTLEEEQYVPKKKRKETVKPDDSQPAGPKCTPLPSASPSRSSHSSSAVLGPKRNGVLRNSSIFFRPELFEEDEQGEESIVREEEEASRGLGDALEEGLDRGKVWREEVREKARLRGMDAAVGLGLFLLACVFG